MYDGHVQSERLNGECLDVSNDARGTQRSI